MSYIQRRPPTGNRERFDARLYCPDCGDSYLHHNAVEVFHRPGEDAPSIGIGVERGRTDAASPRRNPSPRRGGLLIWFDCEGCGRDDLVLEIYQHKGETFWNWQ